MRSEKANGNVMIRAVLAAALALLFACVFAFCLPNAHAFADEMANAKATASEGAEAQQAGASEATAPANSSADAANAAAAAGKSQAATEREVTVVTDAGSDAIPLVDESAGDLEKGVKSPEVTQPTVTTPTADAGAEADEAVEIEALAASPMKAADDANEAALKAAEVVGDWETTVEGDTVVLNKYKGSDKNIVVPGYIDGKRTVIKSGGVFGNVKNTLESIVFEVGSKLVGEGGKKLFHDFKALKTVDLTKLDASDCTSMELMFGGSGIESIDLSGMDASKCATMAQMFLNCTSLVSADLSNLDVSSCKNMKDMFYGCESMTTIDVSGLKLDTEGPVALEQMFQNCKALTTIDVSNWNTQGVTNMAGVFRGCESLTTIDVSNWNTQNVTTMRSMFQSCTSLATLDVSNWDVRNVETFESAFYKMPATTVLDLRKWNAASVGKSAEKVNGLWQIKGWSRAFHGPMVLVNNGQMFQRTASPNEDGKYIGFDVDGFYGAFLEDSMDRTWCLNYGVPAPAGYAYKRHVKHLDDEGIAFLETLIADVELDKKERWQKIAAAMVFYGDVLGFTEQYDLQHVIWHYSDNHVDAVTREQKPLTEAQQKMVDYIEANWQNLDYSKLVIVFYDSETNPTIPSGYNEETGKYEFHGKLQNMISLATYGSVIRKDMGSIEVSKEIATKSNADTDQEFTFTVKLTDADGKPLATPVSVQSEGEDLHAATPVDGVITLTTTGVGTAHIYNVPVGVTYVITEGSVEGWTLVGTSGAQGTSVSGVTSTATFTNDKADAETSATVRKVWDDRGDRDKLRPSSITVSLSNGSAVVATVTLNEGNGWKATVDHLPKYADGKVIEYTWTEGDMPEGYKLTNSVTEKTANGTVTTLTNSHEVAKKEKKETHKEKKTTSKKQTKKDKKEKRTAGGLAQTGDNLPVWPLIAVSIVCLAALIAARRVLGRKED